MAEALGQIVSRVVKRFGASSLNQSQVVKLPTALTRMRLPWADDESNDSRVSGGIRYPSASSQTKRMDEANFLMARTAPARATLSSRVVVVPYLSLPRRLLLVLMFG